jgi:iron complex outermembrane recepter protein
MLQRFFLLFSLFLPILGFSQQTLTGQVQDEAKKPIEFASVVLFNADSTIAKAGMSEADGSVVLPNVAPGSYRLRVSMTGYTSIEKPFAIPASTASLGILTLMEGALDEVTVTALRPIIEVKPDMTVFNVEGTINATGSNGLELLRKAPGVVLDQNNAVTLRGKSGVQIYIDGKPSPFQGDDLVNFLRNLTAAQVDRIEIITNPSARFDAAGTAGIINIKLKKNQALGFNGSINMDFGYGWYHKAGTTLNANYRAEKFNVFGNVGYYDNKNRQFQTFSRKQSGRFYDQDNVQVNDNSGLYGKVGADYFINSKSTIGILFNGNDNLSNDVATSSSDIGPLGGSRETILRSGSVNPDTSVNLTYNINYRFEDTTGITFNVDADFGQYRYDGYTSQPNSYFNSLTNELLFSNNFANRRESDIDIYTIKSDHERPLFGGKLGVGAKFAKVVSDNNFRFYDVLDNIEVPNAERTNRFVYDEQVSAAYVNYGRAINKKWKFQSGLRLENTNALGYLTSLNDPIADTAAVDRNYTNLFPSAGLTYELSDKHSFGLTYSRRISRPNYQSLNPFENKIDELTYQKGNPLLQPQFANSYEINYTFMGFAQAAVNYTKVKDVFAEIVLQSSDSSAFLQTRNVAEQQVYSFNLSTPLPIKKWWSGYLNFGITHQQNVADFGNGNIVNISALNFNTYMQHTFELGKGYKAELSGWYSSKGIWAGAFLSEPMGSVDLGFQKSLFKERALLRLSFSDLFFTSQWGGYSQINGFRMNANGGWESQQAKINFNYSFGNQKVKESRNRRTGLEDEKNRIGG